MTQIDAAEKDIAGQVLVTGGSGFVAGWCIVELLKRGYRVRTTIRDLAREPRLRAAIAAAAGTSEGLSFLAADLLSDEGWDEAMQGCARVLHVASPLSGAATGDRHAFVAPARDGTLRVLAAAVRAGVERVVMTSAAATARPPLDLAVVSDETIWADPDDPQFDAYRVSKILAEKAAWDFMREHGGRTEFCTVLPGAVFGPLLFAESLGSVNIIAGLLRGYPRALPRLGFWVVDVRDLADLHIRAMTLPQAAGERFIAAGDFMWMEDMARALRGGLGPRADRVPKRRLPTFIVKLLPRLLPQFRTLAPLIGRKFQLSSAKARTMLGFSPRSGATTIVDCGSSLLNRQGAPDAL